MKRILGVMTWFCLILAFAPEIFAAPVIISQTRDFLLEDPKTSLSRWNSYPGAHLEETNDIDLEFYGAPKEFMLAGQKWELTDVYFNITSNLYYKITANARDGFFSDCYTEGQYYLVQNWDDDGLFSSFFDQYMHSDYEHIKLHDESWWLEDAQDGFIKKVHVPDYKPYGPLSTDNPDPNLRTDFDFLDVQSYTITLRRYLEMDLLDYDTNDDENWISLEDYVWEGNVNIEYEYNPASVPVPAAVWLLGSGLIGLFGLRRKLKG